MRKKDNNMQEVFDSQNLSTIYYALQRTPIHFLGVGVQARVNHAYYTGVPGVYLVFIEYGHYALRGICFSLEPEIQVYLDLRSTLAVVQQMITSAINEHDNDGTDNTGRWHMQQGL
jgi:hypothetical protein